jgi:hypothetical protein
VSPSGKRGARTLARSPRYPSPTGTENAPARPAALSVFVTETRKQQAPNRRRTVRHGLVR